MSISYARPLGDIETVEHFLCNCLGLSEESELLTKNKVTFSKLAKLVRDAENANKGVHGESTLDRQANRDGRYRDDKSRGELRKMILSELINRDRLENDDDIELGKGGAKPRGMKKPIGGHEAYFIVGLPASGKSSIVTSTADTLGAMIIDSDFAKRKLPEFDGTPVGANLVHKESSLIVLGGTKEPSLLGYCTKNGYNVVLPTIGSNFVDIREAAQALKHEGYRVHLSATILSRKDAAVRAAGRFLQTERYVPLGLIFDGYANDPVMNYYRERCIFGKDNFWASMGSICTDVMDGEIEYTDPANPVYLRKGKVS
jgi:hypothetical protein